MILADAMVADADRCRLPKTPNCRVCVVEVCCRRGSRFVDEEAELLVCRGRCPQWVDDDYDFCVALRVR